MGSSGINASSVFNANQVEQRDGCSHAYGLLAGALQADSTMRSDAVDAMRAQPRLIAYYSPAVAKTAAPIHTGCWLALCWRTAFKRSDAVDVMSAQPRLTAYSSRSVAKRDGCSKFIWVVGWRFECGQQFCVAHAGCLASFS